MRLLPSRTNEGLITDVLLLLTMQINTQLFLRRTCIRRKQAATHINLPSSQSGLGGTVPSPWGGEQVSKGRQRPSDWARAPCGPWFTRRWSVCPLARSLARPFLFACPALFNSGLCAHSRGWLIGAKRKRAGWLKSGGKAPCSMGTAHRQPMCMQMSTK